ncbi:Thionin-like protein [Drosera capensis]
MEKSRCVVALAIMLFVSAAFNQEASAVTELYYCWGKCFNACLKSQSGDGLTERAECSMQCFTAPCVADTGILSFHQCCSHCVTASCVDLFGSMISSSSLPLFILLAMEKLGKHVLKIAMTTARRKLRSSSVTTRISSILVSWEDCIFPPSSSITAENGASASAHTGSSFKFCNLGCAALHCANMSSLQNPGGKEVEDCVISCSEDCRKNYSVPYSPKH